MLHAVKNMCSFAPELEYGNKRMVESRGRGSDMGIFTFKRECAVTATVTL